MSTDLPPVEILDSLIKQIHVGIIYTDVNISTSIVLLNIYA